MALLREFMLVLAAFVQARLQEPDQKAKSYGYRKRYPFFFYPKNSSRAAATPSSAFERVILLADFLHSSSASAIAKE